MSELRELFKGIEKQYPSHTRANAFFGTLVDEIEDLNARLNEYTGENTVSTPEGYQIERRKGERRVRRCDLWEAVTHFGKRGGSGRCAGSDRRAAKPSVAQEPVIISRLYDPLSGVSLPEPVTGNTESAALLAVRVRELENQLAAADVLREAFKNSADAVARQDTMHLAHEMDKAIAAYDAARGK